MRKFECQTYKRIENVAVARHVVAIQLAHGGELRLLVT